MVFGLFSTQALDLVRDERWTWGLSLWQSETTRRARDQQHRVRRLDWDALAQTRWTVESSELAPLEASVSLGHAGP